jgi:hypothetical protein
MGLCCDCASAHGSVEGRSLMGVEPDEKGKLISSSGRLMGLALLQDALGVGSDELANGR